MNVDELTTQLNAALEQIKKLEESNQSTEETKKTVEKLQSDLGKALDKISKQESIIKTFSSNDGNNGRREDTSSDLPDPMVDAEGYAAAIEKRIAQKNQLVKEQNEKLQKAIEDTRKHFYSKYPELVPYPPMVAWFTNEVLHQNPDIGEEEGFAEVAKRTKEWIGKTFEGHNIAPPAPHTGGGSAPKEKKKEEEAAYDPAKETADAVKEMQTEQSKRMKPIT